MISFLRKSLLKHFPTFKSEIIFFPFFPLKLKISKIVHIYLSWTTSALSLNKIRELFFFDHTPPSPPTTSVKLKKIVDKKRSILDSVLEIKKHFLGGWYKREIKLGPNSGRIKMAAKGDTNYSWHNENRVENATVNQKWGLSFHKITGTTKK